MVDFDKSPYFSKRIRIGDVLSPKDFAGLKERTIEVIIGNSEKPTTYSNPKDVSDIKSQNMKEMLLELFAISDEIAKEKKFTFVDQVMRENK